MAEPLSKLSPWIETLIRSYGSQQGNSSGRLKAHVIGVGQMSQSQAQGTEGPTGILVLSDGVLQISAVLTATAWEHLQEQEDRECFTSLVNTTVYIQDYRMQFHMALELSKCRFFLLVGKLATTAAGPVKDNTPCCTSLSSVRMKICETWRALLGQETQDQCKFDLSDLLGEWQHGCLEDVLEDVEQRLKVASCTSSTSNWDVDRVRSKGLKCFSVPIKCLHIPEEDSDQLWIRANPGNRTTTGVFAVSKDRNRDLSEVCKNPESTEQSVDDVEQQTALPAVTILSNPWDIFPPCVTSSPSDASPGKDMAESTGRKNRNAKRKTHKPTQETLSTSVEVHKGDVYISDIPPSWLLDTKAASDPKEGSRKGVKAATVLRKTPCLHSDGRPFSYSYQVSGQNLQNCSQFRISESLLLWAVKYLVTSDCEICHFQVARKS
uniref:Shelterin complex subunit TPP1/Est3 domain-containing protein n=1 Tax=Echeneis naucrates TaxID=173247 RepID=A0A665VAU4_ECHNA